MDIQALRNRFASHRPTLLDARACYAVLVPLVDSFKLYADDAPNLDLQEVRISIYSKGSYTTLKNAVVRALLRADISVTARQYIGYETDTGYFHYNVDAARVYEMEES